jgi:primosomal replication protein N
MSVLTQFPDSAPVGVDELNRIVDAINLIDSRVPDVSKYWTWGSGLRHYDNSTGQKKMVITSGSQLVTGALSGNSMQIPVRFGITFSETPAVVCIPHAQEVIRISVLTGSLTVNGFTAYLTQDNAATPFVIHAISYIAIGV